MLLDPSDTSVIGSKDLGPAAQAAISGTIIIM